MTIHINHLSDLSKVFAFIRACAKGDFAVPPGLVQEVIERVLAWAEEHHVTIRFEDSSGQKIAAYTALGAAAGFAAGCFVPPYGPIAGFIIGALAGFALAQVTIQVTPAEKGGPAFFTIL